MVKIPLLPHMVILPNSLLFVNYPPFNIITCWSKHAPWTYILSSSPLGVNSATSTADNTYVQVTMVETLRQFLYGEWVTWTWKLPSTVWMVSKWLVSASNCLLKTGSAPNSLHVMASTTMSSVIHLQPCQLLYTLLHSSQFITSPTSFTANSI